MKKDLSIWLEEWILEQKLDEYAPNTLKQYRNAVLKFIEWIPEDKELNKFTTMEYKEHLRAVSNSLKSINVWIVSLNKFFKWLKNNEYITDDITVKKYKMQEQSSNEGTLTKKEFMRMKRLALANGYEQLYYILQIMGQTGCRVEELKLFTVENLEKTPFTPIKVFNKQKERKLIVIQKLSRELKKYYKSKNITSGTIFPSSHPKCKGKMINQSTIFRQLKKVAGIAKVKKSKVYPHNFRHYFAQRYAELYPDDSLGLADILGHNDLRTTRIYTKTSGAEQRRKLEKVKF